MVQNSQSQSDRNFWDTRYIKCHIPHHYCICKCCICIQSHNAVQLLKSSLNAFSFKLTKLGKSFSLLLSRNLIHLEISIISDVYESVIHGSTFLVWSFVFFVPNVTFRKNHSQKPYRKKSRKSVISGPFNVSHGPKRLRCVFFFDLSILRTERHK